MGMGFLRRRVYLVESVAILSKKCTFAPIKNLFGDTVKKQIPSVEPLNL